MRLYSGRGTSRCRKADANRKEMSVPPRLIFGSSAAAEGPRQSPSQSGRQVLTYAQCRLEPGRPLTRRLHHKVIRKSLCTGYFLQEIFCQAEVLHLVASESSSNEFEAKKLRRIEDCVR